MKQQLATCIAERDRLANANRELERQLEKYREEISRLKRERGMGIFFFGGDIIYEVAPEAFRDYRAGLRFRALIDSNFAAAFKMFEEGKGGDEEVLRVVKEIDTSGDRYIDIGEASSFRKAEEDKYDKMKITPPAKP